MEKDQYRELFEAEDSHWWFTGQRALALNLLSRRFRGGRILDAGCGTGGNTAALARLGRVTGIDLSREALEFSRQRGLAGLGLARLESLPFKGSSFDLVTCFGVLYHRQADDARAFQEFSRVLKPDGLLLLTTPAMKFLRWGPFRTPHDDLQHTGRRHSRRDLESLCALSGLVPEKISYYTTLLSPLIILARLLVNLHHALGGTAGSELGMPSGPVNRLLERTLGLEKNLLRRMDLPFGVGLVCLARKGSSS